MISVVSFQVQFAVHLSHLTLSDSCVGVFWILHQDDALKIIFQHSDRLETVERGMMDALDHVLAEDVLASRPHPPFRASVMVSASSVRVEVFPFLNSIRFFLRSFSARMDSLSFPRMALECIRTLVIPWREETAVR